MNRAIVTVEQEMLKRRDLLSGFFLGEVGGSGSAFTGVRDVLEFPGDGRRYKIYDIALSAANLAVGPNTFRGFDSVSTVSSPDIIMLIVEGGSADSTVRKLGMVPYTMRTNSALKITSDSSTASEATILVSYQIEDV